MGVRFVVVLTVLGLLGVVREVTPQDNVDSVPWLCQKDSDCWTAAINATCLSTNGGPGECRCPVGHFNKSGVCTPRTIGDPCTSDADCKEAMSFAFCPRLIRKCRCASGYKRHQDTCVPLRIGDNCRRRKDCLSVVPNSFCSKRRGKNNKRVCQCEENHVLTSDGACEYKTKIGDSCLTTDECRQIGSNVMCERGTCVCKAGFKSLGPDSCGYLVLNDYCSKPEDCGHILFSGCRSIPENNTSRCLCNNGHRGEDDGLGCSPRLINEACSLDADCGIPNSLCNESQVCACHIGYTPPENLFKCELQQITEVSCDSDAVCVGLFNNTDCDSQTGHCKCRSRYFSGPDGFVCFFRHLEERCRVDEECSYSVPNSQCIDNTCTCKPFHTASSDKMQCRLQIIGGKNCTYNTTCWELVRHSYCDVTDDTEGRCACQLGYRMAGDYDKCLDVNLMDECSSDVECLVTNPHSWCAHNHQACHCEAGYSLMPVTPQRSKVFCQKRRIGRHQCHTKTDCTTAVVNSHCQPCHKDSDIPGCRLACFNLTTRDGQFCQGRKLWENCTEDEDCSGHIDHAHCRHSSCYCLSGFRPSGRTTCVQRTLGNECYLDADCSDAIHNSTCVKSADSNNRGDRGSCACVSGFVPHNNRTECRRRRIGESNCRVHTDCSDAVPNSRCHAGMCVCLPGFHAIASHYTACTKWKLTDRCSLHRQCHAAVPNSECRNLRCLCKSGFARKDDMTCVKRRIGDGFRCRVEKDCADAVKNSTCESGYCACANGYHEARGGTTCVLRRIGDETCSDHLDCTAAVANSTCHDGACLCMSGFYPSEDKSTCIQRTIGDSCTNTTDCSDVIENSECFNETCECLLEYDVHRNNYECFLRPQTIGSPCISTEQCQLIHNASSCQMDDTGVARCVCASHTFVDSLQLECVPNPRRVGDRCDQTAHCLIHLENSKCNAKSKSCKCDFAHFDYDNGTVCHHWPKKLTDRCLKNVHCRQMAAKTECDMNNNTCVCQYGYTQTSDKHCSERPRLRTFKPNGKEPLLPECKDNKCEDQPNSVCKTSNHGRSICQCDKRFARRHRPKTCLPVQSYQVRLRLVQVSDTYDYLPLTFKAEYKGPQLQGFRRFARRVTFSGIKYLMEKIRMRSEYINSEVLKVINVSEKTNNTKAGLEVLALLHLRATQKYYNARQPKEIYDKFLRQISLWHGELGISRFIVGMPYPQAINISDFDECSQSDDNDCSPLANCLNTVGSFMCICKSDLFDRSHYENKLQGRICEAPNAAGDDGDSCSSSNCKPSSRDLFVALALTLVFLVVISFIVYEIIQHKQSFNAKKLYEKFGTTKIRHLKKASWRRIQESKKKRKKKKKRKSKKNKSKDGSKSEEEGESSLLTPTSLNTEEVPPSPIEIIHSPAQPIEFPVATPDDRGFSPHEDQEAGLEFIDSPSEPIQY